MNPDIDASDASPTGTRTLQTLEKGLQLLSLFDIEHPQWSLRQLREASGESKTNVLRMAKTLERLGYLTRDVSSGKLRLGSSIIKLSYVTLSHTELVRMAATLMRDLSERTQETVDLMVEIELDSLMSLSHVTSRLLRPQSSIGKITHPGLTTAASKIFIAFRPEETWDTIMAAVVKPLTERTITDLIALREELAAVRRDAVAFDLAEWNVDLGGVAAPVFGSDGSVQATLTVVSPIERSGAQEMALHAYEVRKTVAEISRELGAPLERLALLNDRGR